MKLFRKLREQLALCHLRTVLPLECNQWEHTVTTRETYELIWASNQRLLLFLSKLTKCRGVSECRQIVMNADSFNGKIDLQNHRSCGDQESRSSLWEHTRQIYRQTLARGKHTP